MRLFLALIAAGVLIAGCSTVSKKPTPKDKSTWDKVLNKPKDENAGAGGGG